MIVYSLMSCGKSYIGQTGRCVNDCLGKRVLSIGNGVGSRLPFRCASCGCASLFGDAHMLGRGKESLACELPEVYHMGKKGDDCISVHSFSLYSGECLFLDSIVAWVLWFCAG